MPVSSFLSASNIFLIVVLLAPPSSPLPFRIGTLGDTFHVLFQLKRFFHLLRSTRSDHLWCYYSAELMSDMLETIVEWLQVSVSECNRR